MAGTINEETANARWTSKVKKPGPIKDIVPEQSSQNGTTRVAHAGEHRAGNPSEQSGLVSPPQQIGVIASMSWSMARLQALAGRARNNNGRMMTTANGGRIAAVWGPAPGCWGLGSRAGIAGLLLRREPKKIRISEL